METDGDGRGDAESSDADSSDSGVPDTEDLTVALVTAVAENDVIGRGGELPWHYPEDLQHFKETTMGHPVVMGRRTFEGIVDRLGEPLPGRTNVVLSSRDLDLPEGAVHANSIPSALDAAREALSADAAEDADGDGPGADRTVYVVGGASVYEQFLPLADRLVLTEIPLEPEGDTYFPAVDWSQWAAVERDDRGDLSFVTYERRA
ncbi:dihydrofolate reductase [Halobacteriales archaeon QS_1_68_20]|nr:MAG: dihydrofolate reductase [Halobacteriales archaeon QS_1_68_20]